MKPSHQDLIDTDINLIELARHLRQEFLFVSAEKQRLQQLNEKVHRTQEQLFHQSWIAKQQRLNLDRLILSPADSDPAHCCRLAGAFETVLFTDSYKALGGQDVFYSDFLGFLQENPRIVALCLTLGEKHSVSLMHSTVNILMSSLYGNCVLPQDEVSVLKLLKELITLQLSTTNNPLRLLRHVSCAFSRVYKAFTEGLFTAKLFLTAALHDPIMHLLMEDDLFLDVDPIRAVSRFHLKERLRHFGREGTPEFEENVSKYRGVILNKLVALTNRFIAGFRSSMSWFPRSLVWLVREVSSSLTQIDPRELGAICTDLMFGFFICPAIMNPEPYGLVMDVHISNIARFNLMQVAQILQIFAMAKWEEPDPRFLDLYGHFDKDCMSSFMDQILNGSCDEPFINQTLPELKRTAVLITKADLLNLVSFFRTMQNDIKEVCLQRALNSYLSNLPNSKSSSLSKVNGPSQGSGEGDGLGADLSDVGEVLVVPLGSNWVSDSIIPGMLPEEKVLSLDQNKHRTVRMNLETFPPGGNTSDSSHESMGAVCKRTRFSQDQESIDDGSYYAAGTSDNLEAVSEAASNHSVSSSLDLENDNLSDMVSANVSGRGTPNVSGRDTPSSQLEGEEQRVLPSAPPTKQNPEDLEEKFGRFPIKPLVEDETKSMVSDTWSTDVLASDSEMVEQPEPPQPPPPIVTAQEMQAPLDTSETASDAWSTDVVTSDTDRLQELDTDDNASVTRSDDLINFTSLSSPPVDSGTSNNHSTLEIGKMLGSSFPKSQNAPALKDGLLPLSIDVAGDQTGSGTASQEDLTPTGNCSSDPPTLVMDEDSFNNMQSLGRLTLAVKEQESESLINAIQDNLTKPRTRTSLAEILSLDLAQTLNISQPSPPPLPQEDTSGQAEFDQEVLKVNEAHGSSTSLNDKSPSASKPSSRTSSYVSERRRLNSVKELEDSKHNRKSFFKLSNFRLTFKVKPKKHHGNNEDSNKLSIPNQRNYAEDGESGDDILAKYRKKSNGSASAGGGSGVPVSQDASFGSNSNPDISFYMEEDSHPNDFADPNTADNEVAFANAKRKLRIVLSRTDLELMPPLNSSPLDITELTAYLRMLLAEAINLQQRSLMAQLHETLRCVASFDHLGCQKLLHSLQEDYKARAPYVAYLVRSTQGLLSTLSYLETLVERIERDKMSCTKYLLSICVRLFLEKKEKTVQQFVHRFQALNAPDEKAQLVEKFLEYLYTAMETDPIWQFATEQQLEYCQAVIQRSVMGQIYIYALYPNGDADLLRDRVLHEHMSKLAQIIKPSHRELRIPKVFQHECPWPSAQAELISISAFKTPMDKLHCVLNCLSTLVNLLRLATDKLVPAADDIVPVLVYVLIQANPPSLLSTIQYINTFLELEGEDAYWWTQFCSATEFIKNLDYS